jgi:hypothetical protein
MFTFDPSHHSLIANILVNKNNKSMVILYLIHKLLYLNNQKMSDPESFEENENIVMNIHDNATRMRNESHPRGSNVLKFSLDVLGEQRSFFFLILS